MSRSLVVEADGGSRGNPGVAGYGALVRDGHTGEVLAERAAPLGKQSNNVAEYSGLIAGLEEVLALDPGAVVDVRMDSKLVIEQMAGRWKIKHEDMRRLALQARELVRSIEAAGGSLRWTWVPRERNKAADALSNDGMDGRTIVRRTADPGVVERAPAQVADGPVTRLLVCDDIALGAALSGQVAGTVVEVTSAEQVRAVLAEGLGLTRAQADAFVVEPGSVTAVTVREGEVSVGFVNRTPAPGSPPAVPFSGL